MMMMLMPPYLALKVALMGEAIEEDVAWLDQGEAVYNKK